ncbi:hypothetical protein Nepgr_008539 [Nepenthes gracilis]|uniref:Uncharacterized protein n=1 Tax=Nepenthes gracilis TaxID=150966 RepID=A0AAD3S9H0_NEPGR|nr:hypothetical protein Nepgr_008539 [Nepenthes gracilis]
MDREQEELQFLGFFGIFKESIKLILTCSKIFTKITLSLILPLSFTFLSHIFLSMLLSSKIIHNEHTLDRTYEGTAAYNTTSAVISSELTAYWLIKAAYFTFLLIFSLLSTAAVVYTVACVYTAKDITFRKVMSVVPKVWKRLMVTFLWSFAIVFIYNIFFIFIIVIWVVFIRGDHPGNAIVGLIIVIYFVGLVYLSMIWQLAGVVSVLEDRKGLQAMRKSKDLIKGKIVVALALLLMLNLWVLLIQFLFEHFVVVGRSIGIAEKVGFGIVSLLLLSMAFLLGLVVQTVIYFVCKSYHHENIDKSSLADHLEVYLGEYVPLKAKDLQLGEV